jgi:subtilisin family serine protease
MTHPLRMRICLPAVAVAIAAGLLLPALAAAEDVVPGQVIVRYEAGSPIADRAAARDDAGTKPIEGLGMARSQLLKITDGDSVSATVRQLEAQPGVAYAEPDQILQPAMLSNDPQFLNGNQWGLYNDGQTVDGVTGTPNADISAPAAWNLSTGGLGTVVAVMDTGADLAHPDLAGELWTNPADPTVDASDDDGNGLTDDVHGADFLGDSYDKNLPGTQVPDGDPKDLSGHGTHVSGIALAEGNNAVGVSGVSQHASLMSLRICGTYDNGCPNSALIAAINYAADHGARVVNGSIAGGGPSPSVSAALASHPGTLYVFAAGNGDSNGNGVNNDSTPNFPCTADQGAGYGADNVICVAATTQTDRRADFSNYGAGSVDLGAPGVNIYSTSSRTAFYSEDFEGGDISTTWTNTGASTWGVSTEAPHNGSFGITDSPGGDYAPGTDNEVTSNAVTLPAGYSSCELDYFRQRDLAGGDSFTIEVLLGGVPEASITRSSSSLWQPASFELNSAFDGGGQVQVRLRLSSDGNPATVADGIHMDDIELVCHGSPSDNGDESLDGTSMAAPMVTGAAALLFTRDAALTATEVKNALLDNVDPLPDLTGTTVSGGRLNVYRALIGAGSTPAGGGGGDSGSGAGAGGQTGSGTNAAKPNTFFKRKPGRVVRGSAARTRVVFKFGADKAGSSFRCELDSVEYTPCPKRYVRRLLPGRHVLKVRAVDPSGVEDPSAAVAKFRVKRLGA